MAVHHYDDSAVNIVVAITIITTINIENTQVLCLCTPQTLPNTQQLLRKQIIQFIYV